MARTMKLPDTEISCRTCKGTKVRSIITNQGTESFYECGGCFGCGLSTDKWDQKRHATTTGTIVGYDHPSASVGSNMTRNISEWRDIMTAKDPTFQYEHGNRPYPVTRNVHGVGEIVEGWAGMLVSWANPLYESRLAEFLSNGG